MKLFEFKSLRNRLVFWFLVLTLFPLLISLGFTYIHNAKILKSETFDKLSTIRDLKVERVNDWLEERVSDMYTMSLDQELTSLENLFITSQANTSETEIMNTCRQILNRYASNIPVYSEISILDPRDGNILISTLKYLEGEDRSKENYFINTMHSRQLEFTDIHYSMSLSSNILIYSIPIFCNVHEGKDIVGVLVASIDLDHSLYDLLLDRKGLGKTGETLIVNKEGIAVNELRWYDNAPLKLLITAEPAVNAAAGNTGITISEDYRGQKVLAAYTFIPGPDWGFVCKQDLKELNSPVRRIVINLIIIFLIVSLIITALALSISKSITQPLLNMLAVSRKVSEGDYSVRNTNNIKNELGSLSRGFNRMIEITSSRIKIHEGAGKIFDKMLGQTSLNEFGTEILKELMDITHCDMSSFYILNERSGIFEPFASIGMNEEVAISFNSENPAGEFGKAVALKKISYLRNIPEDTLMKFKTSSGYFIPKEIITIPVLLEDTVAAIISLVNIREFSRETYEILQLAWTGINTSYSSLLSNERTQILADHLARMNSKLEAQTEELQNQTEELQEQAEELNTTTDELKEQNIELELQRKQVESANKLKSEFLSNMSHELRTPLNSVLALSRVLIDQTKEKLNDDENNYLVIIERNGRQLLSLINDILDLSKIEAGKMEIIPGEVSIEAILMITMENLNHLAETKGLDFQLDVCKDLSLAQTDEARIHQVFSNVISNAIKFTHAGSVHVDVTQDSSNIFIEVKDTGIGISESDLPFIFEEFKQADGSSSRKYEGTGLGLSIADKLISILGGKITVTSILGEGSVFTITIPKKWNTEQYTRTSSSVYSSTNNQLGQLKPSNESSSRILIIEDNPDAIVQLKAILKSEQFSVDIANSGNEAMGYCSRLIPDGIILDLMMPDIDGFEVLEKLRGMPATMNIPILVLTAKDLSRKELKRLESFNIQQLIYKGNVNKEDLLRSVNLMIEFSNSTNKKTSTIPRVLIAEDNADNMTSIKAILGNKVNIIEAVDGIQAIKLTKSQSPDLILLDMSIPKIKGEDIIKLIREDDKIKDIPIIAVTAQAMKGDKEKYLAAGCDGFVAKPIDADDLWNEINGLLEK